MVKLPSDRLNPDEYRALLRRDLVSFAQGCFSELNPRTRFAMSWHIEIIAAKLTALRGGKIRRLVINLPPRHLKSLLASVAFPAWCLGHDPSAQILCVSYAQDLSDKLARDCRSIMTSAWYRGIFPTRLAAHRQAVQEFITTAQGYRLATSNGGVLTGRGADIILIDDPLKPEEALSDAQRQAANDWFDHTLYSRLNDTQTGAMILCMHRLHEDDPRAMCCRKKNGRSCGLPRSPRRTRPTRSRPNWNGTRLPGGAAGPSIPSASHCRRSSRSAAR